MQLWIISLNQFLSVDLPEISSTAFLQINNISQCAAVCGFMHIDSINDSGYLIKPYVDALSVIMQSSVHHILSVSYSKTQSTYIMRYS